MSEEDNDGAAEGNRTIVPTPEMFAYVEQWAKGVLADIPNPTPVQALYTLSVGMFVLIQQKEQPDYTEQELNDMGKLFLQQHTLSASFPFSNEEIARFVVIEKAKDGARAKLAQRKKGERRRTDRKR